MRDCLGVNTAQGSGCNSGRCPCQQAWTSIELCQLLRIGPRSTQHNTAQHRPRSPAHDASVGCREVSAEEYATWEPVYHRAKTALQDRDAQLDAAAELIEKDLLLLGATAIEDKLQEVRALESQLGPTVTRDYQTRTEKSARIVQVRLTGAGLGLLWRCMLGLVKKRHRLHIVRGVTVAHKPGAGRAGVHREAAAGWPQDLGPHRRQGARSCPALARPGHDASAPRVLSHLDGFRGERGRSECTRRRPRVALTVRAEMIWHTVISPQRFLNCPRLAPDVLTPWRGPQVETAINIGYACSLLTNDQKRLVITSETPDILEAEHRDGADLEAVVEQEVRLPLLPGSAAAATPHFCKIMSNDHSALVRIGCGMSLLRSS